MMEMVMEMSGSMGILNNILDNIDNPKGLLGLSQDILDATERIGEAWTGFHSSLSKKQHLDMDIKGYSFMDKQQLEALYGKDGPFKHTNTDIEEIDMSKATPEQRKLAMRTTIKQIAGELPPPSTDSSSKTRARRALDNYFAGPFPSPRVILSPYAFAPTVDVPSILGATILSPSLFSPFINSIKIIGVNALSPTIGSAFILSPYVLAPLILSPTLINPYILSPFVFGPFILSPLVMTPFVLSPYVFSPNIVTPYLMSPLILSPNVLCPDILSPTVLGGSVLSPTAMSPSIATTYYLEAEEQSGKMSRLTPRESGRLIAERSRHIKLNESGIEKTAQLIFDAVKSGAIRESDFDAHDLHPKGKDQAAVDWVFLMDVINFSFWSEADDGVSKFLVTYNSKTYSGYFAACACVNRALDNGIPVTSAQYMAKVTKEELEQIFLSDTGTVIPLLDQRVAVMNEAGNKLLQKFNGTFYTCVQQCHKKAEELLRVIVENFESFRDYGLFDGTNVSFLKRAQILVADVYGCLKGKELGAFDDISSLTMFADYRVPQALAYLGALTYSDELMTILKAKTLLDNGSDFEMELRGCSIHVCEMIVKAVSKLRTVSGDDSLRPITAMDVDIFLWVYRRKFAEEIERIIPFHRVRCIYY
uniref:Queuosine 5'-phosphate N-glycosylase/hydrolase n=1 Tax=Plectus sambesii TaxID=2011161 RepID=A0A914VWI7_9BILA